MALIAILLFHFAALSSCQDLLFPDFTPTGYIRDDQDCVNSADNAQCSAVYQNFTKPDCTGCPLIQLDECGQIVNCETATDVEYAEAAFQFNTAQPDQPDPCTIVMADSVTCIQAAVRRIRELRGSSNSNLQISIRSGRHSYIGASTVSKGVIVDVSRIKTFQPDPTAATVVMGVGNTLIEVYSNLWNLTAISRSLFPGGTCPTVALAGLMLGGGQGIVGRRYGLAADNILQYQMVNATGDVMVIDTNTNSDLFWALRGGGNGNFGIVYQVILQRFDIPEQNTDVLLYYYNPTEWLTVFQAWQNYILSEEFIGNENIWTQLTITPTKLQVATHTIGTSAEIAALLEAFDNAITNVPNTNPSGYQPNTVRTVCNYTPQNYSGAIAFWAGCTVDNTCGTQQDFETCLQLPTQCCGHPFNMNSGYQGPGPLSTLGMQTLIENILNVESVTGCRNASVQMDSLGGRINTVPSNSTAFPHRNNIFGYQYITYFVEPCNQTAMIEWLNNFYANMTQFMGEGSYRNYANIDLTMPNERYFLGNLDRLMEVKSMYDPNNFFQYSQSISPSVPPNDSPPSASAQTDCICTQFVNLGATPNQNFHYLCCNVTGQTDPELRSCDSATYSGGLTRDYCDPGGVNIGGGVRPFIIPCSDSCIVLEQCTARCNSRGYPEGCLLWAKCFTRCCATALKVNATTVAEVNALSFCGDGNCRRGESGSCNEDCCSVDADNCRVELCTWTPPTGRCHVFCNQTP